MSELKPEVVRYTSDKIRYALVKIKAFMFLTDTSLSHWHESAIWLRGNVEYTML